MQIRDAATLYQTQLEADGRALATRMQYARHVRALQGWLEVEQRERQPEPREPRRAPAAQREHQRRERQAPHRHEPSRLGRRRARPEEQREALGELGEAGARRRPGSPG